MGITGRPRGPENRPRKTECRFESCLFRMENFMGKKKEMYVVRAFSIYEALILTKDNYAVPRTKQEGKKIMDWHFIGIYPTWDEADYAIRHFVYDPDISPKEIGIIEKMVYGKEYPDCLEEQDVYYLTFGIYYHKSDKWRILKPDGTETVVGG